MTQHRTRLLTLLLGTVLFIGQFAALVHATEHPFHVSNSYCSSLSSLSHSSHGLLSQAPHICAIFQTSEVVTPTVFSRFTSLQQRYQARAPPLS